MAPSATKPGPIIEPMLASRPRAGLTTDQVIGALDDGWIFEPKLDGFRCLVHVVDGTAVLRSRTGNDITSRFSATPLPASIGSGILDSAVIDGELIAVDERGQPSFNRVQRISGRPQDPIAIFVAFDLLYHPELLDLRDSPWTRRRSLLEELQPTGLTLTPYSASADAMWKAVVAQDLEGAIAKRKDSRYRPGRTGDWIKVKRYRSLSAVVTAFNAGEGSRSDNFGSLALALFDSSGDLVPIGDVGTGFTQADLVAVSRLDPPFVIEVRFQEWTGTALRMPVFQGVRHDVPIAECTFVRQLPEGDTS